MWGQKSSSFGETSRKPRILYIMEPRRAGTITHQGRGREIKLKDIKEKIKRKPLAQRQWQL